MALNNNNMSNIYGTSSKAGDSKSTTTTTTTPSTTVIKYEKSSCLFCSEWFDSQTFTEHLIHCGQVCEACPNACNVYIPRVRMRAHLRECPRTTISPIVDPSRERLDQQYWQHRLQVLDQDIDTLRTVLNEEIRQRLHLITDVGNLRKQNQITDDWARHTEDVLECLEKRLQEENAQRCFEQQERPWQQDFRYCNDIMQTLKTEIQDRTEELRKNINEMSYELTGHQNLLNENILKLEDKLLKQDQKHK